MKMKICLLAFCLAAFASVHAQQFSEWISDSKRPGLKVRWAVRKNADNYTYLVIQMQSNAGCKLDITGSVCNSDRNDRNGWKSIQLYRDRTSQLSFKILNACNNGFWWWYKNYRSSAVLID